MSPEFALKVILYTAVFMSLGLALSDTPEAFRSPALRFLYRGGLPLYSKAFESTAAPSRAPLQRWELEHLLSDSRYFFPLAQPDGHGRFLIMEFVGLRRARLPAVMRGTIAADPKKDALVLRGYLSWSHLLAILAFVFISLIAGVAQGAASAACMAVQLGLYLLAALPIYLRQASRYARVGKEAATLWSIPKPSLPAA